MALFFFSAAPGLCGPEDKPPRAPVHEVQDDYFGTKISDPYRWMENIKQDPEAQKWLKGQADFTRQKLDSMPGYNKLKARITQLVNSEPATVRVPQILPNGNIFYLKTEANQNTAKLCFRASRSADEVTLVDPDDFQKRDGKPYAINYFVPSWDGSHVVFGISTQGSEEAVIHVTETATAKETGDVIPRCPWSQVSWFPDGKKFLYTQLEEMKPGQPCTEKYFGIKTRLHKLGSDPDKDEIYLATGANPTVQLTPQQFAWIQIIRGSDVCIVSVINFVSNELAAYTTDVGSLDPNSQWVKLCDFEDQVTGLGHDGSNFYFLTHKDAPRFKIEAATLRDGKLADRHVVIPESEKVIQQLISAKDGIYYTATDGVDCRVYKVGQSGVGIEAPLPYQGWASFSDSEDPPHDDLQQPGVLITLTSWTRARAFYQYDAESATTKSVALCPTGPYDTPTDLVSEEIKIPSYDGTPIPVSIVGPKEFRKDGTHAVWLEGYGSYGFIDQPFFWPVTLAFLEQDIWYVTAHLRGGGVYGDAWHRAGMKATKPNTWKDFIACGEFIVKNGMPPRIGS